MFNIPPPPRPYPTSPVSFPPAAHHPPLDPLLCQSNITGRASSCSTRYYVDSRGRIARSLVRATVSISGLPHLRMFGGSGGIFTLDDGSMVGISKAQLSPQASPSGRLSAVCYRSVDNGTTWTFASVVAQAEEVSQLPPAARALVSQSQTHHAMRRSIL